jgi:hypothetical protein
MMGLTIAAATYGGNDKTWDIITEYPIPPFKIIGRKYPNEYVTTF